MINGIGLNRHGAGKHCANINIANVPLSWPAGPFLFPFPILLEQILPALCQMNSCFSNADSNCNEVGKDVWTASLGCFASATVQWKQLGFGVWAFFCWIVFCRGCMCFTHYHLDFTAVGTLIRSWGALPMLLLWKRLPEQMENRNGIRTPTLLSYKRKRT